jgi:hypothetical protein
VLGYVWVRIRVRASDSVIVKNGFSVMASTMVKIMVLLMV